MVNAAGPQRACGLSAPADSSIEERCMTTRHMSRRELMKAGAAGAAAALATPYLARAAGPAKTLKVVLESEAVILDPYFTTAAITRSFGYHVYDTLFAMDDKGAIRPQMVDRFESSPDHLTWTFQLRDGLRWHDGGPSCFP